MPASVPRLAAVQVEGPTSLRLSWKDGRRDVVDLSDWIATGGDCLAALGDPAVFAGAALSEHGSGVTWDGDEGDLGIDAAHLDRVAASARPRLATAS